MAQKTFGDEAAVAEAFAKAPCHQVGTDQQQVGWQRNGAPYSHCEYDKNSGEERFGLGIASHGLLNL